MPEILVLCSGREGRRIVEDQLKNIRGEVAYLDSRTDLRIAATESGVRAVVSDLFDGDGRPTAAFLRDLNHECPEIKIILSYDPSPAALDDVFDVVTCGARVAFAARPFNHIGHLLAPMLTLGSPRPPSMASHLVTQVVGRVDTTAARRCLTLASVNPAHRLTIAEVARFCDATERTLYRHLEALAPAKVVLSALAWPQANYLLTALRWRARQVAAYFGYPRPAYLIDLLADYAESGLWRLGLDAGIDDIVACTANASDNNEQWLHHRRFRARSEMAFALVDDHGKVMEDMPWTPNRRHELGERILRLLGGGVSPIEVVRRLWRGYDISPGHLYRSVMQLVQAMRSGGLVEER